MCRLVGFDLGGDGCLHGLGGDFMVLIVWLGFDCGLFACIALIWLLWLLIVLVLYATHFTLVIDCDLCFVVIAAKACCFPVVFCG